MGPSWVPSNLRYFMILVKNSSWVQNNAGKPKGVGSLEKWNRLGNRSLGFIFEEGRQGLKHFHMACVLCRPSEGLRRGLEAGIINGLGGGEVAVWV